MFSRVGKAVNETAGFEISHFGASFKCFCQALVSGIRGCSLLSISRQVLALVFILSFLSTNDGLANDGKVYVQDPLAVKLFYVSSRASGGAIDVPPETKQLHAQLKDKKVSLSIWPAIKVTMSGTITPMVEALGSGMFRLTVADEISMPQFSPETPGHIKSQAARDEARLKLGLRKWQQVLSSEDLESQPVQLADISSPFSKLTLFSLQRPKVPEFKVFWRKGTCDNLEKEFKQTQTDYIALVSSIPVLDQFEVVTRSMDEIKDALDLTAEGVSGVAANIGEVTELTSVNAKIDGLMEETEGLSESLTQALERVKDHVGKEHKRLLESTGVGKPLAKVKEGLEKSSETMSKVSAAVDDLNKHVKMLERLVQTSDAEASEQLKTFEKYFGLVKEELGPLLKLIPGLGVFFDLYGQAIKQIADSAKQIEEIRDKRNRQARKVGIPEPYVKMKTARERNEAEKNKFLKKMNDLGAQIAEDCPGIDLSGPEYGTIQKIEDAQVEAEKYCEDRSQSWDDERRIRREYRLARRGFRQENLDSKIDTYKQMREAQGQRIILIKKARKASTLSKRERAQINGYLEQYYTDKNLYTVYEENKIRYFNEKEEYKKEDLEVFLAYIRTKKSELKNALNSISQLKENGKRFRKAKAANDAIDKKKQNFRSCVKNYVLELSDKEGWDRGLVELLNSRYFYNP